MKKLISTLFLIAVAFTPYAVFSDTDGTTPQPLDNPLRVNDIPALLKAIVDIVVQIGFYVALVAIVYSGFLFVTAQGNETKLATAKKALTYALIGTAILMSAWVFALAIEGAVNNVKNTVGTTQHTLYENV